MEFMEAGWALGVPQAASAWLSQAKVGSEDTPAWLQRLQGQEAHIETPPPRSMVPHPTLTTALPVSLLEGRGCQALTAQLPSLEVLSVCPVTMAMGRPWLLPLTRDLPF